MRHRVGQRKLGRVTEHRIAMLRNQALDLLRHERIQTTLPRAKELRPFVERLITVAKRGAASGETSRAIFARRLVRRDLHDPVVVKKLFDTLAPRYADRPGGYIRLLKLGYRRGDNTEVAQVELVGSEYDPNAADTTSKAATKAKPARGVGGRLRAAAQRLAGNAPAESEGEESSEGEASPKRKRKTARKSAKKSE